VTFSCCFIEKIRIGKRAAGINGNAPRGALAAVTSAPWEQVSPRRRWRRSCLSPLARFEKFLAATDGSSFSADAVKVAIAMCVKSGAHLYPFNMVLTNPEYETLAPELVEKASEDARAHLEAIVAEAAHHGVGATMVMRPGDRPDVEIVAAADEINADLIVMGKQRVEHEPFEHARSS
jgi:uncharacterized protein